jgi:hypothetical protein
MIRLLTPDARVLDNSSPYLTSDMSLVGDLEKLGFTASSPQVTERHLRQFLNEGGLGYLDQPSAADFRALVEHFDREWVTNLTPRASRSS